MGRRRRTDKHLPARMYLDHGAYFFIPNAKPRKKVWLGRDLGAALTQYGSLIGEAWSSRTLGDVIDRYRIEVLPLKRSEKTRKEQGVQLDRLKKGFGHMLPDNVTSKHCYAYQDARRSESGERVPVAARHEVALLGHIFAKAIRWGASTINPARGLDLGPRSPKRAQVTLEQVEAIKVLANERMRAAIDLAVSIGQRRGDLLTLKWTDVTDAGIYVEQSKGGARVQIEHSSDLDQVLAQLKALKPDIPREFLIRKRNGRGYTEDGFSAIWQRLQRKYAKAGGRRFTFHDLRSVSADGAATPEEARDRLGHADVATTKRHYLRGVTKAKPRS
jgi:integrase